MVMIDISSRGPFHPTCFTSNYYLKNYFHFLSNLLVYFFLHYYLIFFLCYYISIICKNHTSTICTNAIFNGKKGGHRDACVLNAAAAIAAYEGKTELSLHDRISSGVKAAVSAIDSGAARDLVTQWASLTQK